jgi:hypothetical protein
MKSEGTHRMDKQLIGLVLTILGFFVNAVWAWFNIRWEKRTLEHIDSLKGWIADHYYDKDFADERHHTLTERLQKAGV